MILQLKMYQIFQTHLPKMGGQLFQVLITDQYSLNIRVMVWNLTKLNMMQGYINPFGHHLWVM